jgi:hypothetical protein
MKWVKSTLVLILLLGLVLSGGAWARGGHSHGGHPGAGHFPHFHALTPPTVPSPAPGHFHGGHFRHFHGHHGFGFFIGPSLVWPYYYYPYYPYYPYPPSAVVVPSSPPVYIEQGDEQTTPLQQPNYWYYCTNPQGYYPYVKECPAEWKKVEQVPPQQKANYWYYCTNPQGYYPYVKECPTEWKRVVPETLTSP